LNIHDALSFLFAWLKAEAPNTVVDLSEFMSLNIIWMVDGTAG
jgi:hypothetical protein